jgi:hypothetical protein
MEEEIKDLNKIMKYLYKDKKKVSHNFLQMRTYTELTNERIIYLLTKYTPTTDYGINHFLLFHYEEANFMNIDVCLSWLGELSVEYDNIEEVAHNIIKSNEVNL